MGKIGENWSGFLSGKLKKHFGPPFSSVSQFVWKWHLWCSEIIIGGYVTVIMSITDFCSAIFKFRADNYPNKQNHLKYHELAHLNPKRNCFGLDNAATFVAVVSKTFNIINLNVMFS